MDVIQNLTVGGTGIFAGNVSIPNGTSDEHAVNKLQLDDAVSGIAGKQDADADLTVIASLTATTDNFIQSKAGAWASRTIAQVKSDLGLVGTNTGDQTNISGNAATVTTNANLTGHVTSIGNASVLGSFTLAQLNTAISDADVVTGGGTATGTNTGDQTSIVGITGTKAQFNTAVADGDIQFVGDAPTTHTHLLAVGATDVTITAGNLNTLDDGANTALHFHDADRSRSNHTGTQLAATISDFNTAADARVVAGITGKQDADPDLTTIASLTPTTNNFLQAKSGAWASRTIAQVKTDLGITGTALAETIAVNFGATYTDKKVVVLTGKTWVTATSSIIPQIKTPTGMDTDEMYLYKFRAEISNLVVGVGYTLTVYSETTYSGTINAMVLSL
jgi:hypothetical protein